MISGITSMGAYMKTYYPRIADKILKEELEALGAVLINGPNWCGKTTTAKQKLRVLLICRILITRRII